MTRTKLMTALAESPSAPESTDSPLGGPIALGSGRSIRLEVHERLRDANLNVLLLPGSALSENEIAQTFHVSRTPIREALQRLSNEGLIQVVPQVGTFVARMDLARIREALFVREAIECAAFARLPRQLPKREIEALERFVARHRSAVRSGDLPAILAADEAFHRRLLELAGVPGVWRYVLEAREMHRRVRVLARTEYDSVRRSVMQHAAVVAGLAAGRTARAVELLREHIRTNAGWAEDMARKHPEYFTSGFEAEAVANLR
jgi:DNA-binding GntR family transcriptional regulator